MTSETPAQIPERLRTAATTIRRSSMPLHDLIPLLNSAADVIDVLMGQAEGMITMMNLRDDQIGAWRAAVTEACAVTEAITPNLDDPQGVLRALIDWHVQTDRAAVARVAQKPAMDALALVAAFRSELSQAMPDEFRDWYLDPRSDAPRTAARVIKILVTRLAERDRDIAKLRAYRDLVKERGTDLGAEAMYWERTGERPTDEPDGHPNRFAWYRRGLHDAGKDEA